MNKQQYLDALKAALAGLPDEPVAKTLAFYEQRFVDGMAAGQSEESIAAELDEPRKIAMTLRTSAHLSNLQKRPRKTNPIRTVFSLIGLAIFNMFMVVPGVVYASLVAALYACSVAFYFSGIVIASSGLAGVNHVVINAPIRYHSDDEGGDRVANTQTHITIDSAGIHIDGEPIEEVTENEPGRLHGFERGERTVVGPIEIATDLEPESRTTQSIIGFAFLVGGVLLTMLSVVVTRLTFVGLKRYLEMNLNILRGN